MSSDAPKVTVLMPVYNGEKYLKEAIESILNQTFTDFEFLIINDGSTDRSVEIIESYHDPRIRLVHNKTNMKLVATLNKGILLARSEYVARMDCDDISFPERFAKQVAFMDKNPEVGVLGSGFEIIDKSGNWIQTIKFPARHGFLQWCLCFCSPIAHPTVVMRKSAVIKAGGYASEVIYGREKYSGEDYDLWRRLSRGTQLYNLQDVLLYLRKHDNNITKKYFVEHLKNSAMISQMIISERLAEEVPIELIQRIWNQKIETRSDVIQISELICRLYRTAVAVKDLAADEKQLINKDAAMRLFDLLRTRIWDIRVWSLFILIFRLDPAIVMSIAKRIFNFLQSHNYRYIFKRFSYD